MLSVAPIKPKRLRPGGTIGVIAPASPGDRDLAAAGIRWLEGQGFPVVLGASIDEEFGYLAGSDVARATDITDMFLSPEIDAIICLRGGYGTMRLLDLLDYNSIQANPKIFVGYSDITALHLAIGQRTGLVTFHGPMVAADFGKPAPDYTWNYFIRAVTGRKPLGLITNPPLSPSPAFIVPGSAAGVLTGGNLSLIAATLGTPYELDAKGKILCLEEVGEEPYRIDRMLTQLLLAGKLQDSAGIVFDVCVDCEPQDDAAASGFTVEEVLKDRLGGLLKPVCCNVYFGHTPDKATLPLGVRAILDAAAGGLAVAETATS